MKIIIDRRQNIEAHARLAVRKSLEMFNPYQPQIPSADEAHVPGHCEECGKKLWQTINGFPFRCGSCQLVYNRREGRRG